MRARWVWIVALLQMIVVLLLVFTATSKADQPSKPEAAVTMDQPEIVAIEAESIPEIARARKPDAQIFAYPIGQDTIDRYARAFWGLNTSKEKFAFAGVAVHRALCSEHYKDGSYRFKSATFNRLAGVVTSDEFAFYREDAPASEDNRKLAELYLNIHLTMALTDQYTGFAFPSWALYLDWPADGTCAVYDAICGKDFIIH